MHRYQASTPSIRTKNETADRCSHEIADGHKQRAQRKKTSGK